MPDHMHGVVPVQGAVQGRAVMKSLPHGDGTFSSQVNAPAAAHRTWPESAATDLGKHLQEREEGMTLLFCLR